MTQTQTANDVAKEFMDAVLGAFEKDGELAEKFFTTVSSQENDILAAAEEHKAFCLIANVFTNVAARAELTDTFRTLVPEAARTEEIQRELITEARAFADLALS